MEGFVVGDDRVMVSHLQFSDDTVLFLFAEMNNVKNMELCPKIFEMISRLKVNMAKSGMVGIHVEVALLLELAVVIGCKVGNWPLYSTWECP